MAFSAFSLLFISVVLSWSIPKGESGRAFPSFGPMTDSMADSVDSAEAGPSLNNDFYRSMCPEAERSMRSKMAALYSQPKNVSGQLLGLFVHDCFTEGCDASVLLDDSNGSKNHSIEKRAVPIQMNEVLENVSPGLADDPVDPLSTSRRYNGTLSSYDEATAEIPNTDDNITQTLDIFSRRGFTDRENVSLSDIGKIGFEFLKSHLRNFKATRKWIRRGFTDRETVSLSEKGKTIGKMGCEILQSRLDNLKGTGQWIRYGTLTVDIVCLVLDHFISDQT